MSERWGKSPEEWLVDGDYPGHGQIDAGQNRRPCMHRYRSRGRKRPTRMQRNWHYSARELCDWVAGQGYRIDRLGRDGSTGPLDCDALPDFANFVAIPLPV